MNLIDIILHNERNWMREKNDPIHDVRVIRDGNSVTIIAESRPAKLWLKSLDEILDDAGLMSDEDVNQAEEELARQALNYYDAEMAQADYEDSRNEDYMEGRL